MKRIILVHRYSEGTAATNRIIACARSYSILGKEVILILISNKKYKMPEISGVRILSCVGSFWIVYFKLSREIKKLYMFDHSVIHVYGSPLICLFLSPKKYNVFYECTEIPFYGRKKSLKKIIKEYIKLCLAQKASGMIVISNSLKQYYRNRGIRNIEVVNMFVDISRFNIVNVVHDDKYIAYCGTVSNFTDGIDCLIKAFSLFRNKHPEYSLKIAGDFENIDIQTELFNMIEDMGLKSAIKFLGKISSDEIPSFLCGAKILVLSRPDNEQTRYGFPTKLGEYLASGRPVVVTRVGEIPDFLIDGINCRMAEPDNPNEFAQCLIWVADNYEEAKRLGESGKRLTNREFSSIEQSLKALTFMELCVMNNS